MKQKEIFLQSEGDAWFIRNQLDVAGRKLPDDDALLRELLELPPIKAKSLKVLEVGCGDGTRLAWIKNNLNADCYGIEPSAQAVAAANAKGINVQGGTADTLPFDNHSFDIVIFGFCLYLCDREDLFRIASEADRVLRSPGWLMILDFYSSAPRANAYQHCPGVQSYKMDYRMLFTWHPDYACMTHKVRLHGEASYTDAVDEWAAVSVLRKRQCEPGA
ncbi:MAG: class I SAM-dependent methyltransferase [Nitrosomonadales bacterium]|nr:class I SAM-dependent methyltransferase [Nitrosomonadales bacterium]